MAQVSDPKTYIFTDPVFMNDHLVNRSCLETGPFIVFLWLHFRLQLVDFRRC